MTSSTPDPVELAAERAYCAFIESAREYLPANVIPWASLSSHVRDAWMAAVVAAAQPVGTKQDN